MKVGVDLDGVCYDFVGSLQDWLIKNKGFLEEEVPDALEWDFFSKQWGMSPREFVGHCSRAVDSGVLFAKGNAIDGAVEGVQILKEAGHSIHIVTNRSFGSYSVENTARWLKANQIPFDTLTFAADKTLVRTDVFIDDSPENIVSLQRSGTPAIIFDQPWNRHVKGTRCFGWKEVEAMINGY